MRNGLLFFTLASVATLLMVHYGLPTWTRLVLAVPYGAGVHVMTMALYRT
jgi:hypothetical protein